MYIDKIQCSTILYMTETSWGNKRRRSCLWVYIAAKRGTYAISGADYFICSCDDMFVLQKTQVDRDENSKVDLQVKLNIV